MRVEIDLRIYAQASRKKYKIIAYGSFPLSNSRTLYKNYCFKGVSRGSGRGHLPNPHPSSVSMDQFFFGKKKNKKKKQVFSPVNYKNYNSKLLNPKTRGNEDKYFR